MANYVPARLALQVLIAVCCIWWLLYWVLLPIKSAQRWLQKIDRNVNVRFFGAKGSIFFLQGLPVMIIAVLTYVIIALKKREAKKEEEGLKERKPRLNLWTLPIFLRSPLGMLTLGDILFIKVVTFVVIFYISMTSVDMIRDIRNNPVPPGDPSRWVSELRVIGVNMGIASLIPFALLWIPVARGSPLLRVIGVPFEHAVKHHIWLGSLTVWLSAIHTAFLLQYLIHQRDLAHILSWRNGTNVACIPGMIAQAAGILMLLTALSGIRRKFFDLFFRVHHLYLAYLIFFGFHAFFDMYILIVPVLLFFLDRFMRMIQSYRAVDVVSVKVLPSGAIELRFAKPASLTYHALSFVYVLLPSVSRLQWHPFSVASSPLDGTNELSIYIKPLGKFTKNLHDALISSKDCQSAHRGQSLFKCPFSFKVGLEGPYGDESSFYLKYQTLIMVAGGIGVTPFLALLRDILYRYRHHPSSGALPSTIHLIFVCRQAHELDILDTVAPNTILPGYEEHLKIKIMAYVTSKPPVPENSQELYQEPEIERSTHIMTPMNEFSSTPMKNSRRAHLHKNQPKGAENKPKILSRVSPFSATGHTGWVGVTVTATIVGFFVLWGIFNATVITPAYHNWAVILLYIVCVFIAVVPIGGGVMVLWLYFEKMTNRKLDTQVVDPETRLTTQNLTNPHANLTMNGAHTMNEAHTMNAAPEINPTYELHSRSAHSALDHSTSTHATLDLQHSKSAHSTLELFTSTSMNAIHDLHSKSTDAMHDLHSKSSHSLREIRSASMHSIDERTADVESVLPAAHGPRAGSIWRGDLVSGRRPDWKEIFDKVAVDFVGQDVGVVVSGSPFLQVDVARECKRHSLNRETNIMMHYHSVSFEF